MGQQWQLIAYSVGLKPDNSLSVTIGIYPEALNFLALLAAPVIK